MTPYDLVFVSPSGSSSGTGAIDDPLDTYANGLSAAQSYAASDGKQWGLVLLPGVYDEQISQPSATQPIYVKFLAGVAIQYTGIGAAIQDDGSANPFFLEIEAEVTVKTTTGNPAIDVYASPFSIVGNATFDANASGDLITVSGGSLWLENALLTNTNPMTGRLVNQSGGEVRMFGCHCISSDTTAPIYKSGGIMNLDGCRFLCSANEYADAPAAESIQIVDCVSNVAKGANISETVGATLVDPSFSI